ncbi:hypothetical protein CGRA01v4_12561 [Colletotrichum graminicola]|nr:hypothetical protein CGRA01v4_12561 [Colletotrichum graminicola]
MGFSSYTKAGGIFAFMAQATPTAQEKPCPVEKRTTQEVIDKLGLIPNEEKGYFIEAFRDPEASSNRISYLLEVAIIIMHSSGREKLDMRPKYPIFDID